MKVQALNHLRQHVGSISVERVLHTVFDLPEEEAVACAAQGLVKIVDERKGRPDGAHNRKTKVQKGIETK